MIITKKITFPLSVIIILLTLAACNPTRKLKEGEFLLTKNKVINSIDRVDNSEIESYIKQKPNRKIFKFVRFHLWLHNLVNEERVARRRIKLNKKHEQKNERRIEKGKKPKTSDRQLFGEWMINVSEPPVVFDSTLAQRSVKQMVLLLQNKGYYDNKVKDSVIYKSNKRVNVYYLLQAGKPYTINNIVYTITDSSIYKKVMESNNATLLRSGDNFDADVFQKERERITAYLNNEGYYFFTKDYVYYKADTTVGNRKVNVMMGIKNFQTRANDYSDSIVEVPHQRYYINNVSINTDYTTRKADNLAKDTTMADDYYFVHNNKLKFKTRVLLNSVFIKKGELYQLKNVESSYKRLSDLRSFKIINIVFTPLKDNLLDCAIQLSPVDKQSFSIETLGKNTSGALGVEGSFVYQNRNLVRGAELFELRLKASVEAQKVFNESTSQQTNTGTLTNPTNQFNTIELGPEANIYIPRFVVPFRLNASKNSNPRTIFTSAFTYQRRPEYIRNITNLSFGYTWKETDKKRHTINPMVINFVKVELQPSFSQYLDEKVSNLYIRNSFINHLATSTRYTFTYNEQEIRKQANFVYFKVNAESSGNVLRGIYNVVNTIHDNTFVKDTFGSYSFLDIPYSEYLRMDFDFRYYYFSNELNKVVWRFLAGIGKPLANSPSLPFERSFFSGGANGIRAWQSRTLGPGSYANDGKFVFNQFGDGQLELNLEYRYKLFKQLNGALFVDAGNTWLRQPDASRPGGDFALDRFYKEIAIGSGVGVRADFNFFIIRLDVGVKVRDPQFAEDKRWVINKLFNTSWKNDYRASHSDKKYGFFTFNIGIGYPF